MQITFIRHLPTEWNQKGWLQGRCDIEIASLTKKYINEIAQNKQTLKQLQPFDVILASTLKRTQQTAQQYGFKPEIDSLLDELDFGPFEGSPKEMLIEQYEDNWMVNPEIVTLGEPVLNLEKRCSLFMDKFKNQENILVFGHGAWIRAALSYVNHGHINQMNQITIKNNHCVTVQYPPEH